MGAGVPERPELRSQAATPVIPTEPLPHSPWRERMSAVLPGLLPEPPPKLGEWLGVALNRDSPDASGRADCAARVLVVLQAWFEELVARGNELDVLFGMSAKEILDVARQSLALEAEGHSVAIEYQEEGVLVRAMTQAELDATAAIEELRAKQASP